MLPIRFSEQAELLGKITPASYNTEQNTGNLLCENYHRVVIMIVTGTLGSGCSLDVDIEQTSSASGTRKAFGTSNDHDVTIAETDDDEVYIIEVEGTEFDVTNGYNYINVEVTPAGTGIFQVLVFGFVPRYAPPSTSGLGGVTD